ncbi:MAG: arginine decarboxylase, pyruvoyl-dependent [Clostridia bacterium]|nr:arginine decarboxylase, pyruvoyl-dependent [Clostridia bacterium]
MKYYLISSSIGTGDTKLTSFDCALLESGVANYNLVRVSSILPTHMTQRDSIEIPEGTPLNTAYATITTNLLASVISAAVAVGIPADENCVGVIMEYSDYCSETEAIETVENMVQEAMRNRGYEIKEIKSICASTAISDSNTKFSTAFACIAMW